MTTTELSAKDFVEAWAATKGDPRDPRNAAAKLVLMQMEDYERAIDDLTVANKTIASELTRYKRLESILRDRADASMEPGDERFRCNAEMQALADWENGQTN